MISAWRSALPGDICILAIPRKGEETPASRLQQELQASFGGQRVVDVHVTCDRFELREKGDLAEISLRLEQLAILQPSFPVTAFSIKTIKSDFRGGYILKWLVDLNDPLKRWIDAVREVLDEVGTRRFYGAFEETATVTALFGIEEIDTMPFLGQAAYPQHLFTVQQIILSRILGPENYETIECFDLYDQ